MNSLEFKLIIDTESALVLMISVLRSYIPLLDYCTTDLFRII